MHKKSRRVNKRQKRQKRQKCRTRKGGRRLRMRMRMKGGLGPTDFTNIGLKGTYSFADSAHQQHLKMFTFGSQSQHDLWLQLFTECNQREVPVPVYILTSGNKVGIMRTLQLMGWADKFREVLCTHHDPSVNPPNVSGRNFGGHTKYAVIRQILSEHSLSCDVPQPIGFLLDDSGFFTAQRLVRRLKIDLATANVLIAALRAQKIIDRFGVVPEEADETAVMQAITQTPHSEHADKIYNVISRVRNSDFVKLCPAIHFMDVLSHSVAGQLTSPDFNLIELQANPIYQLNISQLGLPKFEPGADFNFTPQVILQHVTKMVQDGRVKILFVDYDKTLQIWEGAIQFEEPSMLGRFERRGMPIVQ
jgi:hypothetical protein